MRSRWRLTGIVVASLVATAGCAAPAFVEDPLDGAAPTAPAPVPAQPVHHEEQSVEVALCRVLPTQVVGDLVSARTLDASGEGSQCTWRLQVPSSVGSGHRSPDLIGAGAAEGGDATLQGAFLDLGAFDTGRPPAGDPAAVADVDGVGDEAYLVRVGEQAPTTLYVRDGDRALSLWLADAPMSHEATERSLARMASLLIDLA